MWTGCVDAWEPKVLRSGAGAHFHSHSIVTDVAWEQVDNYLSDESEMLVVSSSSAEDKSRAGAGCGKQHKRTTATIGDSVPRLSPIDFRTIDCGLSDIVLLVSGGLTVDARQFAASFGGKLVSFPAVDGKPVLNEAVSGSVALFEIARQLRLQAVPQ